MIKVSEPNQRTSGFRQNPPDPVLSDEPKQRHGAERKSNRNMNGALHAAADTPSGSVLQLRAPEKVRRDPVRTHLSSEVRSLVHRSPTNPRKVPEGPAGTCSCETHTKNRTTGPPETPPRCAEIRAAPGRLTELLEPPPAPLDHPGLTRSPALGQTYEVPLGWDLDLTFFLRGSRPSAGLSVSTSTHKLNSQQLSTAVCISHTGSCEQAAVE